jgi:hypothetical protein
MLNERTKALVECISAGEQSGDGSIDDYYQYLAKSFIWFLILLRIVGTVSGLVNVLVLPVTKSDSRPSRHIPPSTLRLWVALCLVGLKLIT